MPKPPHPDVLPQLAAIALDPARPLVICDADDVLFHFLGGFEAFLAARDFYFDWTRYSLDGTIHRQADAAPLEVDKATALLQEFFGHVEDLEPIEGASKGLSSIARRAQVVIMTNIPAAASEARRRSLERHAMDYPMVTNIGGKGPAVGHLAARAGEPTVFLDDLPRQHASVAEAASEVIRVHFVAEARIDALVGEAPDCDHKATSWAAAEVIVTRVLDDHGN